MPHIMSAWPPKYFVPECSTKSIPHSAGRQLIGVAKVESIVVIKPRLRASAAILSRSTTRTVGFVGDSMCRIFVFGRIARSCCSMSLVSTNVVSIPSFGSHCERNLITPP